MANVRRTTIPQFSLRALLLAVTVMAVVSLAVSQALRGTAWVGGVAVGLAALAVAFGVYVTMFAFVAFFARLIGRNRAASAGTPETQPVPTNAAASVQTAVSKTLLVMFLLVSATIFARPAWASSGGVLILPRLAPGEPDKTGGLMLTMDMNWVDSSGYRPVRFEIKSITGPVSADRVFTVRFRPKQSYTRYDSVAVTQVLEIPAGSTSVKATMSVPQLGPWGMFELDVLEDGEYIKQLSLGENQGWASWSATNKGDGASPVTLLLSGADTLTGEFMINNPAELMYVQPDNPTSPIDPQIVNSAPNLSVASPVSGIVSTAPTFADLPTRWIDYTGFDLMIVSLDKLQTLSDKHPAQWSAIRDWLHNGGNLIVYGVGNNWEELDKLERLAGLDVAKQGDAAAEKIDPAARGWNLPLEVLRKLPLQDPSAGDAPVIYGAPQPVAQDAGEGNSGDLNAAPATPAPSTPRRPETVPGDKARFITRSAGLGVLAAIRSTDNFNGGGSFPWKWLYNTIGNSRWQWPARYGVTLYGSNDGYWNFLIPGVGLVPVTNFQILITLFVVVIGPVNYYLLRRWGKLNLTVLTVPTGALFLTAALLLYALFSDGLSVRLRARSMTRIDQTIGEATCWSRLSYYAGLAPAGGLVFSGDTAVVPLEVQPVAGIEGGPRRSVDWTRTDRSKSNSPLEQHLSEGWLNSRTPTQMITARIRKSAARLEIQPATSSGQPPLVKNHLGTDIVRLVLTDNDGTTFTAQSIPQNAVVKFDEKASLKSVLELLVANQPQVPNPNAEVNHNGFFGLNKRRPYYQGGVYAPAVYMNPNSNIAYAAAPQNGGLLENSFNEIYQAIEAGSLPPRTYVAVVEHSPEFQPGTPLAKEESSFHVVVGTW